MLLLPASATYSTPALASAAMPVTSAKSALVPNPSARAELAPPAIVVTVPAAGKEVPERNGDGDGDGDGDGVAEGDALGECVAADVEMSEGETVDEIGGQKRSTVPGCQAMAALICAGVRAHE
jgi:hypothetical protein